MNDIENRAREYAQKEFFNANRSLIGNNGPLVAEAIEAGFDAGAIYALGNQWRDAEKEKPEVCVDVVVIYRDRITNELCKAVAWIDSYSRWHSNDDDVNLYGVVAWLSTPEYELKGE